MSENCDDCSNHYTRVCVGCDMYDRFEPIVPRYTVEEVAAWINYCINAGLLPDLMLHHLEHGIAAVTKRNREGKA